MLTSNLRVLVASEVADSPQPDGVAVAVEIGPRVVDGVEAPEHLDLVLEVSFYGIALAVLSAA